MKIFGISAGPSPASRSELLLKAALDEFSKAGCEIEKVAVRDINISFCDGLRGCEKSGICKWKDDMQILEGNILSSDIIVISSPIYFTSLPAKLKAVVDRCQVYWVQKNLLKKSGPEPKRGIFISVAGREPDFKHAEIIIKAFFNVFNINFSDKFYLSNTDYISNKQFEEAVGSVKKLIKEVVK
ncbi:MAG: flavodoxin family protein [Elusimicrobia bacterium]|nr:flavodoxin family protein [Elusimicrobiota bacterium]